MPKSMHLAVASLALFAAVPSLAFAGSIKDQVPDSALSAYCSEAGVGSKTMASIKLSNGTELTGSIHCEPQDLIVGDVASNDGDDEVDDVGDEVDDAGDEVDDAGDDNDDVGDDEDDSGSRDDSDNNDHSSDGDHGDSDDGGSGENQTADFGSDDDDA
ncbi:MAG: hypothetical protein ACYC0C_13380 [Devosia sp.]